MKENNCKVKIGNETRIYKAGTTYQKIAEEFQGLRKPVPAAGTDKDG